MSIEARPFLALDTDGTICKSSLLEAAIEAAIEEGLFLPSMFAETFRIKELWGDDNNEGTYLSYLDQMIGDFVLSMTGIEKKPFDRVVDTVVRDQIKRRFSFPKRVITELKSTHELVGISGSPLFLVRPYLEDLGINRVYGSIYPIENGRYIGAPQSVGSKALILQGLIDKEVVTQNGSIAIGDTMSDKDMFRFVSSVGRPIMFNPALTLKNYGAAFGWDHVNEVKDNITPLIRTDVSKPYEEVPLGVYLDSLRQAA